MGFSAKNVVCMGLDFFNALVFSLIMCSCFCVKFVSEPFCEWLAVLVGSYLQLTSVSEEMTKVSCIRSELYNKRHL